ncbi:ABC transporter permease [Actinoplanes bogorensis]|uniref:ABC transporter permease n=1 Tax=Paractinoplanes bogorensis TaxID=1610840 RepID=A0ABS5YRD7_9ACTN|nr:ABC transporter permease [Actinoplanes bogorensis]MBU2665994.1 ABC transporter permease [Actinoplanes bogorensis]
MSFNAGDSPFNWGGFSFRWYGELAADEEIRQGLVNTLIVATGSTALSTVLGTLLAVGLARHTRSKLLDAVATLPVILPDIVLAIGLLAFYALVQLTLGLYSVLLAHAVFGTAAVAAVVRTRLATTDPSLEEASRDLGANGFTTFWRITLPSLAPGVVAGALLAFTLSVDEFVIAFFTAGPQSPTLPIVIYSMVRFGVTPEINALATVLLAVTFTAILAAQRLTRLAGSR